MNKNETVNFIIDLYHSYGDADYIGEPITQSEHAIQAAMAAERNNSDNIIIVAALLHDIGHILPLDNCEKMGNLGVASHEVHGKNFLLKHNFNPTVANLVESHVNAKRYLVTTSSEYRNKLSEASKKTMEYQGGYMTPEELTTFESNPLFNQALQIRHYDDEAKVVGMKLKSFEDYREIISSVINF